MALRTFLDARRISKDEKRPIAVTGMKGGKYEIPDADYPQFIDHLHEYLFVERGRPLNLIEQPNSAGPKSLVLDLDFHYSKTRALDYHTFTLENIHTFNAAMINTLSTFFDLSKYTNLRFFVSLRPQAYEDKKAGIVKDGIHIQCPDISLSFEKQGAIRNHMLQNDAVKKAFAGTQFVNDPAGIYDVSCTRFHGWFLYGESKPDIPAYDLKMVDVYNPDTEEWTRQPPSEYSPKDLIKLLSVRYSQKADINKVIDEAKDLYASMASTNEKVQETVAEIPTNTLIQIHEALVSQPDACYEDIELVKQFVRECLSVNRADSYDLWMRLGWCLHNISSSDEMFDLWMEFSQKSSKASQNNEGKLKREWDMGMRKEGDGRRLTIRSLRRWAQEDNPLVFKDILERDIVNYVLHSVSPTHNHVARLMKRMFQDSYRAGINSRSTDWFEFDSSMHLWKKINQGIALRERISLEVADMVVRAKTKFKHSPEYSKMETIANNSKSIEALTLTLEQLVEKRTSLRDVNKIDEGKAIDKQIEEAENAINHITKLQELSRSEVKDKRLGELAELEFKLYNSGFKDSIMKECIGLFYEEDFQGKLNSNPLRIGCANGIIRLDAIKKDPKNPGSMKPMSKEEGDLYNFFEAGTPDDYITFQAGKDLPEHEAIYYYPHDPEDPLVAEIYEFFAQLFPNKELREWVLLLLSSCLEGKNREQCYYTFQGVGGNGKSKLVDLMVMTLGEYQSSLQSTAMTRKRPESGAANPDIMSIKNKRFIYMQEPDDREPLNTSRMKQFSGEDAVEARGLYADQERFKVSGKLFMMCNTLPTINSMDRGTWRRVRLIPFESKFVSPGDKEIGQPNVFLKDQNLNAKLKRWRSSFFSLLVHIYVTKYAVCDNGTLEPAPAVVTSESMKYREQFDSYARFRYGRMRVNRDSDESTSMADIWRAYRYWYEAVGGAGKKLAQAELNRRLEDEFGKPKEGKYFMGVFVFNTEEDVDEYDTANQSDQEPKEQ
jgi:P4 family phage/plasmid primase-like protien